MAIGYARAAIVLGLLSVLGPVAIDTYLPAMPAIAADLGTTATRTQMSLTVYFVSLSVFQIVYGPLSDMIGRKGPLYAGLGLFTAASLGCAVAPNIETLIVLRVIQGIGGCACMVVPRAVVRDLYTGIEAARLMSLILLVFSIGPMLAPLVGSVISEVLGWRYIFVGMMLIGVAGLVLLHFALPETRPEEKRVASGVGTAIAGYRMLLSDGRFLGTALIGGSGLAAFFAFLVASPFVYIDHYGVSPHVYALLFAFNAIGFFSMAQLNARIALRIGLKRMVRRAQTVLTTLLILVCAYFLAGGDSLVVLVLGLFFGFAGLGLVIPSAAVLALDPHGPIAGTASSLMGALQFGLGAAMVGAVSLFGRGEPLFMTAVIAACAVVGWTMAQFALREGPAVESG